MSATVNASLLASYFAGLCVHIITLRLFERKLFVDCPVVNVPGRTFPVEVRYVEDIIEAIGGCRVGYVCSQQTQIPLLSGYHPSSRYVKRSGGRQDDASIQTGAGQSTVSHDVSTACEVTYAEPYSAKTLEVASLLDPDIFNPELLGQALLWIVNTYPSAGCGCLWRNWKC